MEKPFNKQLNNSEEKRKAVDFDHNAYKHYIEDGVKSGLERKHRGMFLKFINRSYNDAALTGEQKEVVDFETYIKMAKITEDLLNSFGKNFETAETDQIKGLANAFASYLNSNTPLYCFSIASNAIQEDGLKDKNEQYVKFDLIKNKIDEIFDKHSIDFEYNIYLADIDFKYNHDKYLEKWQQNINYIKSVTQQNVLSLNDLEQNYKEMVEDNIKQHSEEYNLILDKYEKSGAFGFAGFNTKRERALFQMGLYSVTGKIFENKYPTAIQFDVQKRVYPYEQPFYQKNRINKLPIITANNLYHE